MRNHLGFQLVRFQLASRAPEAASRRAIRGPEAAPSRIGVRSSRRPGIWAALLPLALTAALAAAPAPGPTAPPPVVRTVRGSIPTPGPVTLRVAAEVGNIRVTGGPSGELTYTVLLRTRPGPDAQARLDAWPISVRREGGVIIIASGRGPAPGHTHVTITVAVPPQVQSVHLHSAVGNLAADNLAAGVRAQTAAGNITMDQVRGAVRAETAGGNIALGTLGSSVHAATAGGTISLTSARGPIHLQSQGGNISIGHAGAEAHVATAGGSIVIHSASAGIVAETGGGNIELGDIAGPARAVTGGGNIHIAAAQGVRCQTGGGDVVLRAVNGPVRADTGAGSIRVAITGAPAQFAASELQSGFGTITVYLPPRMPVTVEAAGFSAGPSGPRLTSDFPRITAAAAGASTIHVSLNGGGPLLRIETGNGGIRILKLSTR